MSTDRFENFLVRRELERQMPPPRFVVFADMLGVGQLTEDHPNATTFEFSDDDDLLSSGTSESAYQLNRFQHVLNSLPADQLDGIAPSHSMLFSDCAFLVYANALHAAMSAAALMRRCFHQTVPVRMGLAFGTWHPERFSFDTFGSLTVARAVFYGTGVVRANKAEKAGKGCRIFLHERVGLQDRNLIQENVPVLETPDASAVAPFELNFLHAKEGTAAPYPDTGTMVEARFHTMHSRLVQPISADVERQYTDTFAALNRMRRQLGRSEFPAPPVG